MLHFFFVVFVFFIFAWAVVDLFISFYSQCLSKPLKDLFSVIYPYFFKFRFILFSLSLFIILLVRLLF